MEDNQGVNTGFIAGGGRGSEITGGIVGPVDKGEDYITYCAACSRAHQTYDDCQLLLVVNLTISFMF